MPCGSLVFIQCEEDGQVFFSLDDGETKFTDLIQLVEFYQLNRGVLPCKLKHPCTVVALWHLRTMWPSETWPDFAWKLTDKAEGIAVLSVVCSYLSKKLVNWLMFRCCRFLLWVCWTLLTGWIFFFSWFSWTFCGSRCTTCSRGSTFKKKETKIKEMNTAILCRHCCKNASWDAGNIHQ